MLNSTASIVCRYMSSMESIQDVMEKLKVYGAETAWKINIIPWTECSAMATNLIATYNVRTLLRDQQMQEREEQVRENRSV